MSRPGSSSSGRPRSIDLKSTDAKVATVATSNPPNIAHTPRKKRMSPSSEKESAVSFLMNDGEVLRALAARAGVPYERLEQGIRDEYGMLQKFIFRDIGSLQADDALEYFSLRYVKDKEWKVEENTYTSEMNKIDPCLDATWEKFTKYIKQTSEMSLRSMIDLVLVEALSFAVQAAEENAGLKKLCIVSESLIRYKSESCKVEFNGRMDYGIGLKQHNPTKTGPLWTQIMTIVEAKRRGQMLRADGQLFGYLGCVRARRQELGYHGFSQYGITTDGFIYQIFKITPIGEIYKTKLFDAEVAAQRHQLIRCIATIIKLTSYELERTTPAPIDDIIDPLQTPYLNVSVEEDAE